MKIYIAMAELEDGNRMFERAYKTYSAAEIAAQKMIDDVHANTNWTVVPIVEDIELVDE
jgi:hypothetical protein